MPKTGHRDTTFTLLIKLYRQHAPIRAAKDVGRLALRVTGQEASTLVRGVEKHHNHEGEEHQHRDLDPAPRPRARDRTGYAVHDNLEGFPPVDVCHEPHRCEDVFERLIVESGLYNQIAVCIARNLLCAQLT